MAYSSGTSKSAQFDLKWLDIAFWISCFRTDFTIRPPQR